MKAHRWIHAVLGVVLLAAVPVRAAREPAVVYPPDLALVLADKVKVFAFVPGKDPVTVTANGMNPATLEGEDFRTAEVALFPGLNVLNAGGKRIRVYSLPNSKMEEFRHSTPQGELVFRAFTLHPALDDGCGGCHAIEKGDLAAKPMKEACYGCHSDFEKAEDGRKVYVHAPVAAGECSACHEVHFGTRPKLQKSEKGCLECHDAFPETGAVHYPVKEGECTACHSPHAGPAPKQLVRHGNALCLGCHRDSHAQHRSGEVKGALTQVPTDFPRNGNDLACVGCHAPHQSAERRLFRKPQGELCQTCHKV